MNKKINRKKEETEEEKMEKTIIVCKIPQNLNDSTSRDLLRKYFKKFGDIKTVNFFYHYHEYFGVVRFGELSSVKKVFNTEEHYLEGEHEKLEIVLETSGSDLRKEKKQYFSLLLYSFEMKDLIGDYDVKNFFDDHYMMFQYYKVHVGYIVDVYYNYMPMSLEDETVFRFWDKNFVELKKKEIPLRVCEVVHIHSYERLKKYQFVSEWFKKENLKQNFYYSFITPRNISIVRGNDGGGLDNVKIYSGCEAQVFSILINDKGEILYKHLKKGLNRYNYLVELKRKDKVLSKKCYEFYVVEIKYRNYPELLKATELIKKKFGFVFKSTYSNCNYFYYFGINDEYRFYFENYEKDKRNKESFVISKIQKEQTEETENIVMEWPFILEESDQYDTKYKFSSYKKFNKEQMIKDISSVVLTKKQNEESFDTEFSNFDLLISLGYSTYKGKVFKEKTNPGFLTPDFALLMMTTKSNDFSSIYSFQNSKKFKLDELKKKLLNSGFKKKNLNIKNRFYCVDKVDQRYLLLDFEIDSNNNYKFKQALEHKVNFLSLLCFYEELPHVNMCVNFNKRELYNQIKDLGRIKIMVKYINGKKKTEENLKDFAFFEDKDFALTYITHVSDMKEEAFSKVSNDNKENEIVFRLSEQKVYNFRTGKKEHETTVKIEFKEINNIINLGSQYINYIDFRKILQENFEIVEDILIKQ